MIIYHATFRSYLSNIRKEGLKPKGSKSNFDETSDKCLYFGDDIDFCGSMLECAEDIADSIFDNGIVILAIDSNKLDRRLILPGDPNLRDDDAQKHVIRYFGYINKNDIYIVNMGSNSTSDKYKKLIDVKRVTEKYLYQ